MPLTRFAVKLTLIPTLIFTAIIGLIRAQPYDDSQLRTFFAPPDGCPPPCFMGIRPGVTTVNQAIAILQTQKWVNAESIVVFKVNDNESGIAWVWNGRQPPSFGEFFPIARINNHQGVIFEIIVYTDVSLGSVIAYYGSMGDMAENFRSSSGLWLYTIRYADPPLEIVGVSRQPRPYYPTLNRRQRRFQALIANPVIVRYYAEAQDFEASPVNVISRPTLRFLLTRW